MNVIITLPSSLLAKIIAGEKKFEMRKVKPKHMRVGKDGFFVVEKGTDKVKCWCRVDFIQEIIMSPDICDSLSDELCVSPSYIASYAHVGDKVYLWKISKVISLQGLNRGSLFIDRNPQSFAYCPQSYGESY